MLGRRRVFAVEPLGGRDRAGEDLAHGCIVPGVTSTCRRILDMEDGGTPYLPEAAGSSHGAQSLGLPPWAGASLPGAPGAGADGKTAAAVLGASDPEPPSAAAFTSGLPSLQFLELEEEKPALDPLPSLPPAPGSGVQGSGELLSLTEETGLEAASCSEVRVLSVNPPRLPEVPVELADSFPLSQGHKDPSHWNKVRVLLNWICWRSPGHLKPLVSPDGSGPRIESRTLSESSQCHPHRNTFMPSLVVEKQRAKNLSIC